MIIAALLILGATLLFLTIAFVAILFCIVLPMRRELAEAKEAQARQEDTIERNAGASIGLYMSTCRELHTLQNKVAFVEAYTVPMLPEAEEAPITERSNRLGAAS